MRASKCRTRIQEFAQKFTCEDDGAVAVLFGLSFIVLILASGIAIDSSRLLHTTSRIQRALDNAAIAAARKLDEENSTQSDVTNAANKFFNEQLANQLIDNVTLNNFKAVPDYDDGRVDVSVDIKLPLFFSGIAQASENADVPMSSSAIYRPRKMEIALVVDITGSMCGTAPCTSGPKIDALKTAAKDMVDSLHSANPSDGAVRFSLVPYSASVNAGAYANAVSNGASTDNCVVERQGTEAYSNTSTGAGGFLEVSSMADNPSYSCPLNPVTPLTELSDSSARNAFKAKIDALEAQGGTAGHIGTAWGWYTLSPDWNSTFRDGIPARDYDLDRHAKAIVLMTDGSFNTAYNNGGESYVWPDAATEDPTMPGSSPYQALKLCENMRNPASPDETIQIYTVAFQAPPAAQALLQQCSGAQNYYQAENAADLNAAFKAIAEELSKLRVSG